MTLRPFHLAFSVSNLEATRIFFRDLLGCTIGREAECWIDFDLFGHQITAHLKENDGAGASKTRNPVDGDQVPVPHFGVVLTMTQWNRMKNRLEGRSEIQWIIRPRIRSQGEVGEQATMFFLDPSGNALEFKAFAEDSAIFQRD